MNNIEPGAEEAVYHVRKEQIARAVRRSLGPSEELLGVGYGGRERHGSSYAQVSFTAKVREAGRVENRRGWYGLSVNASGGLIDVFETVTWE